MHILVTGAAGMLGRKLTESFARLDALTLIDVVEPQPPAGSAGRTVARATEIAAPGVAEAIVAGRKATALIRRETDPMIERIVSGWPRDFDAGRALALGFRAETSFDEPDPAACRGRTRRPFSPLAGRRLG
jgi:nucleoside-diphosphate-sugar epimerase